MCAHEARIYIHELTQVIYGTRQPISRSLWLKIIIYLPPLSSRMVSPLQVFILAAFGVHFVDFLAQRVANDSCSGVLRLSFPSNMDRPGTRVAHGSRGQTTANRRLLHILVFCPIPVFLKNAENNPEPRVCPDSTPVQTHFLMSI